MYSSQELNAVGFPSTLAGQADARLRAVHPTRRGLRKLHVVFFLLLKQVTD